MTKIVYQKKRNKATRILLAPLFGVVFLLGWTLYYFGEPRSKQQKPLSKATTQTESVHLMVIPPQQEQTIPA